jgi:ribosomal protein S18 acetylase RimI-like enzyme
MTLRRAPSAIAIERAMPADLAALLASRVLLTSSARQSAIVRDAVACDGCFVARDGSRVAGFVTWDRGFFDRPFVRLLVVEPDFRRRGLGSALVRAVEAAAQRCGELFVSTEATNAPMQALLARLRYEPSGSIDNLNEPGNAELVYYRRL